MKTSTRVFMVGVAGCFCSALLPAAFQPIAAGADSSSLSLLQQSSVTEAVLKAQASGTAPIVASPGMLALSAPKGQTSVGTLTLRKSSSDQHTYYLSTNQSWVWMNPPYGSSQTITSETDQIVITAQTAGLATGTYSAVVYIVDSGPNNFTNMLRIPVSLTVTATSASTTPPPPVVTPPSPPAAVVPPPTTPVAVTPPAVPPVVSTSGIAATPAALVLNAVKGQTAVGTLALRKGGTDQHSYYLSTNQSWIWMNPPYGSTQTITSETDQLVITAQTSSLSPGTYSAVIYVGESGPNNFSNMLRVPVTLTVTAATTAPSQPTNAPVTPPPPPPVAPTPVPTPVITTPPPPPPAPPAPTTTSPIVVSPVSMALTGTNNVGTLTLRKAGTDQHVYSLSASQSWIWMNPPYGSTQTITSETDQIVITAQTSGLAAGTYSGVVYIVDSGPNNYSNTIRVPVTFTVAANQPAPTSPTPSQPVAMTPPPPTPVAPSLIGGITPPPPPAPAPPPAPSRTASATVTWNANTEADLAGYRVYVGTTSGTYNFAGPFEITNGTSFTVPNLPVGTTYFFAVTAFDKAGNESTKSGEVSKSLF